MGREARCKCKWAGITTEVQVLLEANEIIVRGQLHKRVPIKELRALTVQSDRLCFHVGDDAVQLFLGKPMAEKWAAAIKVPPPSLVRKLGITDKSIVRTIGVVEDDALTRALAKAAKISAEQPNMIVACVDTPQNLETALQETKAQRLQAIPIWLVYPKGPGHPLTESSIRSTLLAEAMVDTKVASVSPKLTALRFSLRRY